MYYISNRTEKTAKIIKNKKNIPYYVTAIALFILLKLGFTHANTDDLLFLLAPTAKLVELLTGSQAIYMTGNGYYFENLNIIIEKSCSGFNFGILCFILFTYLVLKYFNKQSHKIGTFSMALICAYLLAIFSNTSRIIASVVVRNQTINFLHNQQYILHEAVGIITNLSFLILAYYLIDKFLKQKYHAKYT